MTDKNKEAIEKLGYIKNQYHTLLNFDDYDEVFDNAIKALEERPTGHWISLDDWGNCKCSVCQYEENHMPNFCENCGADMRGQRNEQSKS